MEYLTAFFAEIDGNSGNSSASIPFITELKVPALIDIRFFLTLIEIVPLGRLATNSDTIRAGTVSEPCFTTFAPI